jgi:hypothetical protein
LPQHLAEFSHTIQDWAWNQIQIPQKGDRENETTLINESIEHMYGDTNGALNAK